MKNTSERRVLSRKPGSPQKRRHQYAQHPSQNALLSCESEDVFTDSLPQSFHELWPIITSKATIVPSATFKVSNGSTA